MDPKMFRHTSHHDVHDMHISISIFETGITSAIEARVVLQICLDES